MQVGFRLKRKETPDLFDSEEMAAAFISVSLLTYHSASKAHHCVGFPESASDSVTTSRFRFPWSRAESDGSSSVYLGWQ